MIQLAHTAHFSETAARRVSAPGAAVGKTPGLKTPGLLHRIYDSLMLSNQRQAERDLARFVRTRGRFTDSLEREISNRSFGDDWGNRF